MTADLILDQGDDEVLDVTITNPDGSPTDLSGCKLWWYVKPHGSSTDGDALIAKTSATGEGITIAANPADGTAEVAIDPEDTASLASVYLDKDLKWALQLRDGTAEQRITTLARGTVLIRRDLIASTT